MGLSKEEILEKIQLLKEEESLCKNYEQAIKILLNSIYGAFGNQYFYFFNKDIAETITLQGQDAIKYAENLLDRYFKEVWPNEKELHAKLGCNYVKPLEVSQLTIAIDTDSVFFNFGEVIKTTDWTGDMKEFIFKFYEFRLKDLLKKSFSKYAIERNMECYLDFELEYVAKNCVWLKKKNYLTNIIWKDGKNFEDLSKISIKGWEAIQSSTPTFVRGKLKYLIKWIFSRDTFNLFDLITELKKIKTEFMLANIDDISENIRVNGLSKYIVNDTTNFEIAKGCMSHVRGAGYYNFLLNNNPTLKNKYTRIKSGEKSKVYYSKDKFNDTFSYQAGNYPYEFAPAFDYDLQFENTVINPINRIVVALGFQPLNRNLIYTSSLF